MRNKTIAIIQPLKGKVAVHFTSTPPNQWHALPSSLENGWTKTSDALRICKAMRPQCIQHKAFFKELEWILTNNKLVHNVVGIKPLRSCGESLELEITFNNL